MKCIALKELPQGQQAGDEFDCNEDEFAVLELVGAAKRAEDDKKSTPRGGYRRRDLQAAAPTA